DTTFAAEAAPTGTVLCGGGVTIALTNSETCSRPRPRPAAPMRLQASLLALAVAALAARGSQRDDPDAPPTDADAMPPSVQVSPVEASDGSPASPASAGAGQSHGSLRVDAPAEGTIGFDGFGPAQFGTTAEAVRQAWGGDLGDAQPSEPGGCYYLIPQPLGSEGYRTGFMIEGDRFVRVDVRDADVTAPGGAKIGMSGDEVR